MPVINRSVVMVSGARMNDELCKFSDEQVSFSEAVQDVLCLFHERGSDETLLLMIHLVNSPSIQA